MAYVLYYKNNSDIFLIGQSSSICPSYFVQFVAKHNSISPSIILNRMKQFP